MRSISTIQAGWQPGKIFEEGANPLGRIESK